MLRRKCFGIVLGLVFIAVGVISALNGFGMGIHISLDGWWTLFIILPCLSGLFTDKDKIGSLLGIVLGIFLFLAARGVILYGNVWKMLVPLLIIGIGLKCIANAVWGEKKERSQHEEDAECMAAFCSKESNYSGETVKNAKIGAVFGGVKCNLSEARMEERGELDVFCAFGGAEIIVPEQVELKINAFCLFGGIADKRAVKKTDGNAPVLEINGFCLFGGADIK